ncbi:MAG: threonylcarbamoyl-AMP synthase [Anaerolineales bacterium]|nr:threonylcarbamoyl-AMP synthase [Anaerolineales bacterium]
MKTEIISSQQPNAIQYAIDILSRGGIIAFPTDTVYGLAALADDEDGIERLYAVKGRQHTKAIALLLANPDQLDLVVESVSEEARKIANAFWPGPITLVLSKKDHLPENLSLLTTVGVRIPDHPVALDLLNLSGPLAVTSANLSGKPSTVSAEEVYQQLNERIHLILDSGKTPGQIPSTVVDMVSCKPKILREGPISLDDILSVLL